MPERSIGFDLAVPPPEARRAALNALAELGWELRDGSGPREGRPLEAREDAARLCCTASPVSATLSFRARPAGTSVAVALSVPGIGPLPRRQLDDRATGLRQRIARWAAQ